MEVALLNGAKLASTRLSSRPCPGVTWHALPRAAELPSPVAFLKEQRMLLADDERFGQATE